MADNLEQLYGIVPCRNISTNSNVIVEQLDGIKPLQMRETEAIKRAILPGLPCEIYPRLEKDPQAKQRTEEAPAVPRLRENISQARENNPATMPLRGNKLANAPRGLQQAVGGDLGVSASSSGNPQSESRQKRGALSNLEAANKAREYLLDNLQGPWIPLDIITQLEAHGHPGYTGNSRIYSLLEGMVKAGSVRKEGKIYFFGPKPSASPMAVPEPNPPVPEIKMTDNWKFDKVVITESPQPPQYTNGKPFDPFSDRAVSQFKMLPETFNLLDIIERLGISNAPVAVTAWTQRRWIAQTKANSGRFQRAENCPKT